MSTLTASPIEEIRNIFERRRPARVIGPHTVADWVTFEHGTDRKHELHNGAYIEMPGGTYEHSAIIYDTGRALGNLLEEAGYPCEILGSEQKVFIAENRGYYPDILIVCGQPQIDFAEVLRNPFALIEVLSESTAEFDRGEKFENYRTIESLRHYILVEQYRPYVQHFALRESGEWAIAGEHKTLSDSLRLPLGDVEIALPLSKIYRRVSFPEPIVVTD